MKSIDIKKYKLPDSPGVYFFLGTPKLSGGDRNILYIGKATSLKDRVKSYMSKTIFDTRGPLIIKMLEEAKKIEFIKTDSVLEALILEASEIKKHQPIYNSKAKDDKSYNYITFTKEDFPKVVITRGSGHYGPFPYGGELKEALKIVRKIFPYRDKCKPGRNKPCFNAQLGLCPGVCAGSVSETEYRKIIRHIKLFFEGKKLKLIRSLEREMKILAKEHKFEKAGKVKKQIFALQHIQDIALIKQNLTTNNKQPTTKFRIEAYDIAHISGTHTVGAMTVVEDGELNKNQYRKFKIRLDSNNDIANLKELLTRRLAHQEWPLPNLIVVDGGKSQINIAQKVIKKANLDIHVVSVIKDERHKAREILGNGQSRALTKLILLANAEAHRFAIGYHRKLRGKKFGV
ncbi:MAG: UvrB/UvrC motif-containing protein [Candidatus Zambryskibacteria bacterium]|nr:UvrB/UvrC motif-containing protein [Candidatus Zambryskibacteria bacterium]